METPRFRRSESERWQIILCCVGVVNGRVQFSFPFLNRALSTHAHAHTLSYVHTKPSLRACAAVKFIIDCRDTSPYPSCFSC